jgi:hypothetical protein
MKRFTFASKVVAVIVTLAMNMGLVNAASTNSELTKNPAYFQLKKPVIKEVDSQEISLNAVGFLGGNKCEAVKPMALDIVGEISNATVVIDQVINLGKKVWALVAEGKPVVNFKSDVASALPQGITCWSDLTNWSNPISKTYEIIYENGFGMEVIRLQYRVIMVSGGSYQGQGKYVGYATVVPADMHVAWGFNLDVNVAVPVVFNQGTKENPIAGLNLDLKWKTTTPFQSEEGTHSFFMNGMGQFQSLN